MTTDFLRELEISQSKLIEEENIVFVVRKCQIEYKSPARLDDLVKIKTTVTKVGGAFIAMHQEMECEGNLLNILEKYDKITQFIYLSYHMKGFFTCSTFCFVAAAVVIVFL